MAQINKTFVQISIKCLNGIYRYLWTSLNPCIKAQRPWFPMPLVIVHNNRTKLNKIGGENPGKVQQNP